ncbi:uncharacterized protein B0H18DRAFT_966476 [Fomitopsis serialis]|uniref:uncharacterized protein n=1 Tax=Fomitopsis serialis TaxID=139415 RepID=UPI002008AAC0|nr:uncharacterized protein B0H18DRAFT_966476 [Neoantrodia serialis]KAH9938295.1 hypothetical protein B0H18DRAFT_966476 [Neoantrodia serialis]
MQAERSRSVMQELAGPVVHITAVQGIHGRLAFALPTSYILNRRWAYYRQLPPSLKAFGVISNDAGAHELDILQQRVQDRWDKMGPLEKLKDVAGRHEYGLIGGAFGWIMRDKYQTMPQKIVQARMWAQGLTIGILIAAGALTHARRQQAVDEHGLRHIEPDHSWRDIVEQTSEADTNERRT